MSYSLQDEGFDRSLAFNSIPTWLGKAGALHFSEGLHWQQAHWPW